MTVADNTSRNQYAATSGQTVFAYTFEIVDKSHIVVLKNGVALSEGTNYSVSNVGNDSGGNVTLTVGATTGDVLTLYRDMPYSRTQNYTNSGDFLASEVNSDFDDLWLAGEQTDRSFSQSIRKPITDSDSISMELPEAATRANKFIKFDANGAVDLAAGVTTDVDAEDVSIEDAGGYYTSDNVEGALQEIGAQPPGFDPNTDSFNIGSDAVSSGTDSIALGHDASATAARDIALGLDAVASGGGSIAIGQETDSTGVRSIAIGKGAQSTLSTSIAIGEDASTLNGAGGGPVAIGYSALSTGISGISLGGNATASGSRSISIGDTAEASGNNSIAFGYVAQASGSDSIAIGRLLTIPGDRGIAIGYAAAVNLNDGVAIGNNARVYSSQFGVAIGRDSLADNGSYATALGYSSQATAESSTALGHGAQASAVDSIAIGRLADAGYSNTISIGANSAAGNLGSTVIGYSASSDVNNINGVAIGYDATANQIASVAIGNNATSNSQFGTALGRDSNADSGSYGTALGYSSEAATYATAVGGNADATGANSTAVGYGSNASNNGTVALGNSAQALNLQAISIGQNASSGGSSNIAIGNAPTTTGVSSIAIGTSANASDSFSISIGADSEATVTGSIAVGKSASATGLGVPIAIGRDTASSGAYGISMGEAAVASGAQTLAIGYGAEANNDNGIAIGRQLTVAGQKAIGIGWGAVAGSGDSIGIGTSANALNTYSISIGVTSQSLASGGVAIGGGAITSATNTNGVAIGYSAQANSIGGVAIGNNARVSNTSQFGTAIGRASLADNGDYSTALGYGSSAYSYATALGSNTDATGNNSTAVGYGADSLGEDAIALGHFAGADADNTIHINASGVNTNQPQTAGYIVIETDDASLTYDGAWSLAGGALSTDGLDVTGDVTFGDNDKAIFGAGSDLQIYHDGSHNFIEGANAGNIYIRNQLDDGDIIIQSDDGLGGMANYVQADGSNGEVRLFHYGSEKLNTTATGIDVTGTATMDGLTVTGTLGNFAVDTQGAIATFSRPSTSYIRASDVSGSLRFDAGGSLARLNIAANGDISFYEDTGAIPKFHWDAADERLGLGTTSPLSILHIGSGADANLPITLAPASGGNVEFRSTTSTGSFTFTNANGASEKMRITSDGSVGIGTALPASELDVAGTTPTLTIKDTQDKNWTSADTTLGELAFRTSDTSGIGAHNVGFVRAVNEVVSGSTPSGALSFGVAASNANASEAMRIDSSQNLLVGMPSYSVSDAGHYLGSNGSLFSQASDLYAGTFSRLGDDGDIVRFRSDSTVVGSIGTEGGALYISSPYGNDSGLRFVSGIVGPATTTGANRDGAIDLGYDNGRFKDLYLSEFVKLNANKGVRSTGSLYLQSNYGTATKSVYLNTGGDLVFGTSTQGVYFGGTSSLNKLDDYEEGTWTGTLIGDTTAPSSSVTATGTYTKIGRQVIVQISFDAKNTTGASGVMRVNGLPFVAGARGVGPTMKSNMGTQNLTSFVSSGQNSVTFSEMSNMTTFTISAASSIYLRFALMYES